MLRSLEEIEDEMMVLYPKKTMARIDFEENSGDNTGLRDRLYREYKQYADHWNALVDERNAVINIQDN